MSRSPHIFVGIDAGGTKTELLSVSSEDKVRVHIQGAGANLQRAGISGTAQVLVDLIHQACEAFSSEGCLHVCAGVSGAGSRQEQDQLGQELQSLFQHDYASSNISLATLHVVGDYIVALEAALGSESGAVVVIGTGSVVHARKRNGDIVRVGGWGYLLGDEGSGNAIGIAGLRLVAAGYDKGVDTAVTKMIRQRFGVFSREDLIRKVYQEGWRVQDVAPIIIRAAEQGDGPAERVLDQQVNLLADQVSLMASRAGGDIEQQVSLLGGLARVEWYRNRLECAIKSRLPAWVVKQPVYEQPVVGALHIAQKAADSILPDVDGE